MNPGIRRLLPHWPLFLALAFASVLVFRDLGGPALWADEGDTAVFARSILKTGLPRAWDGTTFTDSDEGARLNGSLVMVGTPWLPYYLAAGSMALFGETSWAVRLPFALAGLACLPLLYLLLLKGADDRLAAALAAAALACHLQFILYARDGRYPALAMALSLWLALETLALGRRGAVWRWAAAAALLFHTHPLPSLAGAAAASAWVGLRAPDQAGRLGRAAAAAAVLSAPWLVLAASRLGANVQPLHGLRDLLTRLGQLGVEWLAVVPLLGWAALAALNRRAEGSIQGTPSPRRSDLALYLALYAGCACTALAAVQSAHVLYFFGLRYASVLLAFGAAGTGLLLAPLWRRRPAAGLAAFLLLAATHLGGPAALWLMPGAAPGRCLTQGPEQVCPHEPADPADRLVQTDWLAFLADLGEPAPGTVARAAALLRARASSGDILVTNYEWEPLYFHTGLPQGVKVLPFYPAASAALAAGLPRYVTDGQGTDWLLWRWAWEGYRGYAFPLVARLLTRQGAVLAPAALVEETTWENNSNRHFRRYQSAGVMYGTEVPQRKAELYRVLWGAEAARLRKSAKSARASTKSSRPDSSAASPKRTRS